MATTTKKQIVILGGSYAGVSTAHYLLKHVLPKLPSTSGSSFEIVLVSASSEILLRPACPRAILSDDYFPQDKLFVSLPKQFEQYSPENFRFILGRVTNLDHVARTVQVSVSAPSSSNPGTHTLTLSFHALVIATGSSTPCPLFGLNQGDAPLLRQTWNTFRTQLASARNIVIAGGGPTSVEVAGELADHLRDSYSGQREVTITLVTSSPRILPRLRESISRQAETYLARLGVRILTNTTVTDVTPRDPGTPADVVLSRGGPVSSVTLLSKSSDTKPMETRKEETVEADTYIPCTGTSPNTQFIGPEGPSRVLLDIPVADSPAVADQDQDKPSSPAQLNPSAQETASSSSPNGKQGQSGVYKIRTNPSTLRIEPANTGTGIRGNLLYAIGDVSNYSSSPSIHNILSAVPVLCENMANDLVEFPVPVPLPGSIPNSVPGSTGASTHNDDVPGTDGIAARTEDNAEQDTTNKADSTNKGMTTTRREGNKKKDKIFKEDKTETQLIPIGRSKGVGVMMGWRIPSWLVWLVKGRDYWMWTTGRLWSGRQW